MSVSNGQQASANVFNNAFLSRTQDTSTVGDVALNSPDVASGTQISSAQAELNKLNSFVGAIPNTPYNTLPTWTNNDVGLSTNDLKVRAEALTSNFNSTTGHSHDGTAGGGAPISAADIVNSPLEGWFNQGTNITITGGSYDASLDLVGKTPSTGPTVLGVVTNTPYNKALLREATGVDAGTAFVDGSGNEVYARVTEAAGVWTLTFFVDLSGTETPYSFGAPVAARWFYQELYNPLVTTPVYDPSAFVPSDAATADVIDATASQRGLVSTATQTFGGDKTFQDDVTVLGDLQISGLVDNEIAYRNAGTDKVDGLAVAKGDLISAITGGVPTALPVGANGQVLTADSAETLGLKWSSVASPTASGVAFTPTGNVAATNVQAAIAEVDAEKANLALSNLVSTSVNADIDPSANVTRELGEKTGNIFKDVSAGEFTTKVLNVAFTGDTTSASATITAIGDTTALNIYQTVTGLGIQAGSRIISKTGSTVVLDKTATATAGGVSLSAQYALIADSQPQSTTANSGGAFAKSGSVVDGTSGQAEFGTGNATGTGASGDALLKAGEVVSGTRGRALLDGRYAGLPTRTADPADFRAGGLFWNSVTNKFRQSDGLAWSDLAGSGGSGGINYAAANPGAETDTAGFSTYKNTAGTAPTTGTGGSPTFTITRTTTTPLRATGSFLLTHAASNQQGEGAAFPITIDRADQGQQISVSFDYEIASGTYDGGVHIYIVDVTNSTVIQPSAFQVVNVGVNSRHVGCVFQAAINSTSYRVCWHVATVTAVAYTLEFDNLIIGPQSASIGARAKAPTIQRFLSGSGTYTTPANVYAIEVEVLGGGGGGGGSGTGSSGGIGTAGSATTFGTSFISSAGGGTSGGAGLGGAGGVPTFTPGSNNAAIIISSNGNAGGSASGSGAEDNGESGRMGGAGPWGGTTRPSYFGAGVPAIANSGSGGAGAGIGVTAAGTGGGGGSGAYQKILITNPASTFAYSIGAGGNGGAGGTSGFAGGAGASGQIIVTEYYFGDNVIVSDSAATRTVFSRATTTAATANPNNSYIKIAFNSVVADSHGAFNTANNRYVVRTPGQFQIIANVVTAGTNVLNNLYFLAVYKNGSLFTAGQSQFPPATSNMYLTVSALDTSAVVGDFYEIFIYGQGNNSGTPISFFAGSATTSFSVNMLQGPAQIQAATLLTARYTTSAAQTIANGTTTIVNYGTRTFDSAGSVTTGASWRFTALGPGIFEVSALATSGTISGVATLYLQIFKNNVLYSTGPLNIIPAIGSSYSVSHDDQVSMVTGDFIDIRMFQNTGSAFNLTGTSELNYVNVKRISGVN